MGSKGNKIILNEWRFYVLFCFFRNLCIWKLTIINYLFYAISFCSIYLFLRTFILSIDLELLSLDFRFGSTQLRSFLLDCLDLDFEWILAFQRCNASLVELGRAILLNELSWEHSDKTEDGKVNYLLDEDGHYANTGKCHTPILHQ